jgi:hypothetical protein
MLFRKSRAINKVHNILIQIFYGNKEYLQCSHKYEDNDGIDLKEITFMDVYWICLAKNIH